MKRAGLRLSVLGGVFGILTGCGSTVDGETTEPEGVTDQHAGIAARRAPDVVDAARARAIAADKLAPTQLPVASNPYGPAAIDPDAPPSPDDSGDCDQNAATRGWQNVTFSAEDVLVTAAFSVTPAQNNLDAVVGLSSRLVSSFAHLAASVRFNPAGTIDVRDGASYRADRALPYVAGATYEFEVIANVRSQTYSVLVRDPSGEAFELAHEYSFRTGQQLVPTLSAFAHVVDSPSGGISVCRLGFDLARGVAFARAGNFELHAHPNGDLLATSADGQLLTLGPNGELVSSRPSPGQLAVDRDGNIYATRSFSGSVDMGGGPIASAGGDDVAVAKYDAAWNHLSSFRFGGAGDELAGGIDVDLSGNVLSAYSVANAGGERDYHLRASSPVGSQLWTAPRPDAAIAADPTGGFVVARAAAGSFTFEKHGTDGALAWSRALQAPGAELSHVTVDDAGNVLFAGTFSGTVNFGGQDLVWGSSEIPNGTYLVKLGAAGGAHVYSAQFSMTELSGVATNSHGDIVVAGVDIVYPMFFHFQKLDAAGNAIGNDLSYSLGLGTNIGRSGSIALADSGRVYWNVERERGWFRAPYLVVLDP